VLKGLLQPLPERDVLASRFGKRRTVGSACHRYRAPLSNNGLDLAELGFEGLEPEATGRPSYHPYALLKLYIYGYLNRIQSNRRLEREAGRNLEVIWLLRRLTPDDKQSLNSGRITGRPFARFARSSSPCVA
jgi:hypothetical protein